MLNSQSNNPRDTQFKTRQILLSLFPPWLPPAFKVNNDFLLMQESANIQLRPSARCRELGAHWTPHNLLLARGLVAQSLCTGHVLGATTNLVLPAKCMGHNAHMPVADGSLQGRACFLLSPSQILKQSFFSAHETKTFFSVLFVRPCHLSISVEVCSQVNDVEVDGGKLGMGQGVLVERCTGAPNNPSQFNAIEPRVRKATSNKGMYFG